MKNIVRLAVGLIIVANISLHGQQVGNPAPEFEVDLLDGSKFKLSDQLGKVVFIFLFGNTCSSCISIGPTIESSINQLFKDHPNFTAVGIDTWSSSSSATSVTGFRNSTGITFPLAIKGGFVASDYNTTYDRLLVVNHQGVLVHKGIILAGNDINNAIQAIESNLAAIPTDPCETAQINISYVNAPPSCFGESDGTIDITVTGSNPAYTFSWSNGANSEDVMGLSKGRYNVNVTDSEGCADSLEIILDEPQILSITETTYHPSCAIDSLGSIKINVSGGTEFYQISWFNESTNDSIWGLSEGCYNVEVTDAHECTNSKTICIAIPESNNITVGEISGIANVDEGQTYTYSVLENENIVFNWSVVGGTIVSGQGTEVIDIQWNSNTEGQVEISAESESGCMSDTASLEISIQNTTGIDDQSTAWVSVYPNPAGDNLYVSTDKDVFISIYDITGQLKISTRKKQIDLSQLSKGSYFVSIRSEDLLKTLRVHKY